jgi:hypothetical protein
MTKTNSVMIAPFRYEVTYDNELSQKAGVLGVCQCDISHIVLDDAVSPGVLCETLLHEALHAMWNQTSLDSKYTDEQEEEVIFAMSPRIFSFIQDNREVVMEWMGVSFSESTTTTQ